jgi:hypothetical protein
MRFVRRQMFISKASVSMAAMNLGDEVDGPAT